MNRIGCHLSTSKGLHKTIEQCLEINADTFQFFPRNPRGSKSRLIPDREIEKFLKLRDTHDINEIVCHGAYTMNLCSDREDLRELAIQLINEDMKKIQNLKIDKYVLHPGSHKNQGIEKGLDLIVEGLNQIDVSNGQKICIETMSGKGSEVGFDLNQIAYIISNASIPLYVCIDTCHLFSSGIKLVNFDDYLDEFDKLIGIEKIKVIHCNDSMMPFGANKDRHEKFGKGLIGESDLFNVIFNERLEGRPIILETPNNLDGYKIEIEKIRRKFYELREN
ncbi:deoxyribonuclease IV [Finegoldia sp. BIOML-A2]|uniref:deoxyribonuclease IV n=1 Tax=Finegoldia TaxID=150022 RepID=UPI000B91C520|nr:MULTISPECIES: deoxyribonuclease IV [Finegoldia]MCC2716511.1 deoxyribonuclease IV [Finegoldia magna]MDU2499326.1 deoxyribonuclease IV [Finegoldia magna]MDU3806456.1 deoxyribonuclease IV [Finegoldia magna]MDU4208712.1 deoxyribonuclease IV [Finegoldia magna]MSA97143.1 deoxyribonuclease IV [Finegoldia sp. BIOML-A5]